MPELTPIPVIEYWAHQLEHDKTSRYTMPVYILREYARVREQGEKSD